MLKPDTLCVYCGDKMEGYEFRGLNLDGYEMWQCTRCKTHWQLTEPD